MIDKEDLDLIKSVLKENEDALAEDDYETLYRAFYRLDQSRESYSNHLISPLFTELLRKAGVNPLLYMKKVPPTYATYSTITSISIPNNIESIEREAFNRCEKLKSIKLSNNLKRIEWNAFGLCTSLEAINLPEGLDYIAKDAFLACTSLTEVAIPDSVSVIKDNAFYKCKNLKKVTLGANLSYLGGDFIEKTSCEEIMYKGSTESWKKLTSSMTDISDYYELLHCEVICADGKLRFDNYSKKWYQAK